MHNPTLPNAAMACVKDRHIRAQSAAQIMKPEKANCKPFPGLPPSSPQRLLPGHRAATRGSATKTWLVQIMSAEVVFAAAFAVALAFLAYCIVTLPPKHGPLAEHDAARVVRAV